MNEDSGTGSLFAWGAVGRGALWGLAAMLLGAMLQGIVGYRTPLSGAAESIMAVLWQAVGSLVAGFLSARRAPGSGWLHGALSGLLLFLAVALVNGIATALPAPGVLMKLSGLASGAGALGGIFGVNTK